MQAIHKLSKIEDEDVIGLPGRSADSAVSLSHYSSVP